MNCEKLRQIFRELKVSVFFIILSINITLLPLVHAELIELFSCDLKEPKLTKSVEGYTKVELNGTTNSLLEPHKPIMPVKPLKLLIPKGYKMKNIRFSLVNLEELEGNHVLEIAKDPKPVSHLKANSEGSLFPSFPYEFLSVQNKHGLPIILVNLFPVQYDQKTEKLFYYKKISVLIEATQEAGKKGEFISLSKEETEDINSFVDNPEVLETYIKGRVK